jgi:hypothetical protein
MKTEYARAEAAKDRRTAHQALAAKLLEQAAATRDDPAERFVLYRESRDQAVQAANGAAGLKAVGELGKEFAVNVAQAKADVLEAVGKRTVPIPANKVLVTEALQVLAEVLNDEDADAAGRIYQVAHNAARTTGVAPVIASVEEWRGAVEARQKEAAQLQAATRTLQEDPNDATANRLVGMQLCFHRGEWASGLPLLVKADDANLRRLAQLEVEKPRTAAEQLELGDGWWALAGAEKGRRRANLHRRAFYWYQQALPGLNGLARTRAAQRVQQVYAESMPDPATFRYTEHPWSAGKPAVELVANSRGFAFLSSAGGNFQGGAEWLRVQLKPGGSWQLEGSSNQSSLAGAAIAVETPLRDFFQKDVREFEWNPGMAPVKMIPVADGICFLTAVGGGFIGGGEQVGISVQEDHWVLSGRSATPVGARAVALLAKAPGSFRGKVQEYVWAPGSKPIRLISAKDGFCFLSSIEGGYRGGAEVARVSVEKDGFWYLSGNSNQASMRARAISVSLPRAAEK